jgi:hypothetical protein
MRIKFFERDEFISPELAKELIDGLSNRELPFKADNIVTETALRAVLSTIASPYSIGNDPDSNPDPVAEANSLNHRLSRLDSDLRVVVEE